MPITAKEESLAALQPGAELFARLGDLYTQPTVGEAETSARLKKSVAQLDKRLTAAQLKCLRDTVQALASHLDREWRIFN